MYVAGFLFPVQPPVSGQAEGRGDALALGIDPGVGVQPAAGFEQAAGVLQQVLMERRVEEHQVEGARSLVSQVAHGIAEDQLGGAALERVEVVAQGRHRFAVGIQGQPFAGAARQRLEEQRAAAGEGIEHPCAFDIGCQPVEQGLADPVRGRSQAGPVGKDETPAAPFATDDPQLSLAAVAAGAFAVGLLINAPERRWVAGPAWRWVAAGVSAARSGRR